MSPAISVTRLRWSAPGNMSSDEPQAPTKDTAFSICALPCLCISFVPSLPIVARRPSRDTAVIGHGKGGGGGVGKDGSVR